MVGRVVALACAVVGSVVLWTPVAAAETVVSGDRDSNASLVIDPSSDPDDPLVTDITEVMTRVFFIQSMPVTKRVNQVTLGDFARLSGCGSGQALLQVHEHTVGALVGSPTVRHYATAYVPVPTTPSKLTWTFPAFTMRQGYGYTFELERSGCSTFKQTTWEHNEPQINGGPARCTAAPQGWRRMWHDQGIDDAQLGCADYAPGFRTFDPSMPSGWLVSQIASSLWDIRMTSRSFSDPPATCVTPNPPNTYDAWGAVAESWRSHPGNPSMTDYSCEWSQYAPLGTDLDHGWYYAQPWLTLRSGAPRDMYLELDTIDYDALLAQRTPIVAYHSGESFHVLSPSAATDFYDDSDDPDDPDDANRLVDGVGAFASANHSVAAAQGIDELGIDYLGESYDGSGRRSATDAQSSDYLSERGSNLSGYRSDAAALEADPSYADKTYGRVVQDPSGKIWLQYWLYYYYDPQVNFLGSGAHEGDWEMVQVRVDASGTPDKAAYSQHGGGEICLWGDVSKIDGHPVVYAAADSHASYFRSGDYEDPDPDDGADGNGGTIQPALVQVRVGDTSWVRWPGRWGDSGDSPSGPRFQGSKWDDPEAWSSGLAPCDVS